jgi:hypothetical protein
LLLLEAVQLMASTHSRAGLAKTAVSILNYFQTFAPNQLMCLFYLLLMYCALTVRVCNGLPRLTPTLSMAGTPATETPHMAQYCWPL